MNIIHANGGDDCHKEQRHVHEVLGSVEIAEREEDPHNHRFATVSGQAIPIAGGDHIHEITFRTDFYEDHFHEFCGKTRGAEKVGDRHVHFLESETTVNDGHRHDFRVATLIENPIGD
ncbi:YmaF family protein [Oscillospiraceae bacterium WX1]